MSSDLPTAVVQYQEEPDYQKKCRIAKSFAASQTHFWAACVRRRMEHFFEGEALEHFADAYFKRGPQQKEELISLLHSQDEELVGWLLLLLDGGPSELGPDGKWHLHKGLGGSEMAHHIAGVYKTHPTLGVPVAQTLGHYGPAAKNEVRTLLRIMLTPDAWAEFLAKKALDEIDPEVYAQFGLGSISDPLTDEQRAAIEKYLASHKG